MARHLIEAAGRAPGIGRRFLHVEDPVEDLRHRRRRTFGDGAGFPQDGHHRAFLSAASVLPEDDAAAPCQAHDAARCQEVQRGGQFGRLVALGVHALRFSLAGLIEGLPLRDPIRADAGAVGLHLRVQRVQLALQRLGAPVQLKLRKASGQDGLNLAQRVGFQQVERHRIADRELAVDRLRLSRQALGDDAEVDVGRRRDDRKADQVLSAAPRASGQLLDFAVGEVGEVPRFADARLRDHHRAGGEVHTRSQRRRGEHSVEQSQAHQFLDRDFPGRQMAGVVRGHADPLHDGCERMLRDAGVQQGQFLERGGDGLPARRRERDLVVFEGLHRVVTGSAGCQKDNRWSQMFLAERRDEVNRMDGGRHPASFLLKSPRGPNRSRGIAAGRDRDRSRFRFCRG